MRVLQLTSSSAGGVARHARQVAQLLAPDLVVLAGPPDVIADAPVPSRCIDIADRPRIGDLRETSRLRRLARRADLVHAHGLRAGALAVLATRWLPARPAVVVTLHNLPVGGWRVQALAGLLERIVACGADLVLGVSGDLVARATARGARGARRALVPAPSRPRAPRSSPAQVRASLGLAPDDVLLLTVGRLAPQKGLDLLCDAAGVLAAADLTGLRWVVVGDGPLEAELRARVRRDDLPIEVAGRRDDVPELMAAADVVVSTSTWEGQPLVVQEALAAGAAVVATEVGGTGEVTGDAAVLVAPAGRSIAAGISRLLADPPGRARLAAAARQRAGELPGTDDVVDQLRRVYVEALSATRRAQ